LEIPPIQLPIPLTPSLPLEPLVPTSGVLASYATELSPANFKDLLKKALEDLGTSQVGAHDAIKSLATGGEDNIHDVVISMEKAGLTLQYAIQIRNKMLEGYQTIIQMQI
jgi:flagellar hook-basal body complex protein FliE